MPDHTTTETWLRNAPAGVRSATSGILTWYLTESGMFGRDDGDFCITTDELPTGTYTLNYREGMQLDAQEAWDYLEGGEGRIARTDGGREYRIIHGSHVQIRDDSGEWVAPHWGNTLPEQSYAIAPDEPAEILRCSECVEQQLPSPCPKCKLPEPAETEAVTAHRQAPSTPWCEGRADGLSETADKLRASSAMCAMAAEELTSAAGCMLALAAERDRLKSRQLAPDEPARSMFPTPATGGPIPEAAIDPTVTPEQVATAADEPPCCREAKARIARQRRELKRLNRCLTEARAPNSYYQRARDAEAERDTWREHERLARERVAELEAAIANWKTEEERWNEEMTELRAEVESWRQVFLDEVALEDIESDSALWPAYWRDHETRARAETARLRAEVEDWKRQLDLKSAQLQMVGSELCADPKIDPEDRGDPRNTPTLRKAAELRQQRCDLIAEVEQLENRVLELEEGIGGIAADLGLSDGADFGDMHVAIYKLRAEVERLTKCQASQRAQIGALERELGETNAELTEAEGRAITLPTDTTMLACNKVTLALEPEPARRKLTFEEAVEAIEGDHGLEFSALAHKALLMRCGPLGGVEVVNHLGVRLGITPAMLAAEWEAC